MLLLHKRKLAELVRLVVRAEINNETARITLPKIPASLRQPRSVQLRLDDEEDRDVIEWLGNIKTGYVSTVLKLLIRHAMEKADIRLFVEDGGVQIDTQKRVPNERGARNKAKEPAPQFEENEIDNTQEQSKKNNDLFDLI